MRATRERQREGFRIIPFEIHNDEIELLVCRGYLESGAKLDRNAISVALGQLLDYLLTFERNRRLG